MLLQKRVPMALGFLLTAGFVCAATVAPEVRTSTLKNATGQEIGQVTVTAAPHGVILRVQAKGLTPGWHGMHFHEKADCSDPAFQNSGGHLHAKTPVNHGFLHPQFNDAGDLPNLYVGPDGSAMVEVYSNLVTFKGGDPRPALLDADGAALVIHANPDDYQSQPIGNAGGRIACAVIH